MGNPYSSLLLFSRTSIDIATIICDIAARIDELALNSTLISWVETASSRGSINADIIRRMVRVGNTQTQAPNGEVWDNFVGERIWLLSMDSYSEVEDIIQYEGIGHEYTYPYDNLALYEMKTDRSSYVR